MPGAARHLPLARNGEKASKRGRFADTTIGYVHIDICELRLAEGKLNMFLAIDRVSKFTYIEFHENAGKMNGAAFLANVVKVFPYKIHKTPFEAICGAWTKDPAAFIINPRHLIPGPNT